MAWSEAIPIPVEFEKQFVFSDQGQFHPSQYLYGIAAAFEKEGGTIVQDCRITGFDEKESLEIKSSMGVIKRLHSFMQPIFRRC